MSDSSTRLVIAADPDSTRTALAWTGLGVDGWRLQGVDGGGSGVPVGWSTITGARDWLCSVQATQYARHAPTYAKALRAAQERGETLTAAHEAAACEAAKSFGGMVFVCETQAPNGPQSASVEALRRVRYHWEAACELLGVLYVEVDPSTWEQHFGGDEPRGKGPGSLKKACQAKAKRVAGKRLKNEDQRDAFGILSWYVETQLGKRLIVGG